RFSVTLIEPRLAQWMETYKLQLQELFSSEEDTRLLLARRSLPATLHSQFNHARENLETALADVRGSLAQLDPTLAQAERTSRSKMRYQLDRLEARAALAELRRNRELTQHASRLHSMLYPNNALQERSIAGMYFFARYGRPLLEQV